MFDCNGSVRLESVRVEFSYGATTPAVGVRDSSYVVLVRCELHGSDAAGSSSACRGGNPGGVGLLCIHSRVALYDSDVQGGPGELSFVRFGQNTPAGPGGAGIRVQSDSIVFASNCVIEGGPGAPGVLQCFIPCTFQTAIPPGAGGNALEFLLAPSQTWLTDALLLGGLGGSGGVPGSCCSVPDGAAGSSSPGPANVLPAAHLALVAPTHIREQTNLVMSLEGTPGDVVGLFLADGPVWQLDLATAGVLAQGPTTRRLILGTIPPSGAFPVSIPIGALPPGIEAQQIRLQSVSRSPTGSVRIGSPAVLTILDQAF